MSSSGVTPVRPIEPCLDKYNQVRIFFFDATIMIYHVSLQTCFKCTMVYDKDESGHAPDQPYMFEKSWLIANEMLSDG